MIVSNAIELMKDASAVGASNIITNVESDSITIQVSGDATGYQLAFMGRTDNKTNEFIAISGINLVGPVIAPVISANGIYTFCIEGINQFYLNLIIIGDGKLNAFGRMIQGE